MHMALSAESRATEAARAPKCLQDGHNPRNNFAFEALIWIAGNIPLDPEDF
jgi:hypothetical protein